VANGIYFCRFFIYKFQYSYRAYFTMHDSNRVKENITLRTTLQPGDIGTIVYLHGILYAREYGFDHMFEAYVAGPLSEFAHSGSEGERLWIAERDGQIVGCIAIVTASAEVAQLRWFLVHPDARGAGLGRRLLDAAVAFSREQGYQQIILWTVSALEAAAHLYRGGGFRKVEEKPAHEWGTDVVEEKYQMELM
jgi:N-acetylglutamate synthase-like GNAT family acetyltransferase